MLSKCDVCVLCCVFCIVRFPWLIMNTYKARNGVAYYTARELWQLNTEQESASHTYYQLGSAMSQVMQ